MAKKKAGPKLTGDMAKPIVRLKPLAVALIASDPSDNRTKQVFDASEAWLIEQKVSRLCVVAANYGISPDDPNFWIRLALSLSEEFIPFTRIVDEPPRGPGAPKKNNSLWSDIQNLKKDGYSVAKACQTLSQQEGPWKGNNASSLEQRFYEKERELKELSKVPQDLLIAHLLSISKR